MKLLTINARLTCKHLTGVVKLHLPWQNFVRIAGHAVLLEDDTENRLILGCPNLGATIKPCQMTIAENKGRSTFIRIQGRKVCLDTLTGVTDGTPPGIVQYIVRSAGQDFVSEGR